MIRVERGPEPPSLIRARAWRLARMRLCHVESSLPQAQLEGYNEADVRRRLFDAQHRKRAYCEASWSRLEGQPLEHFRPKKGAVRSTDPLIKDEAHYGWLTWSWQNLFLSCVSCNSQSFKGNHFPLLQGTCALCLGCDDLAQESPMLIDPALDDPMRHLRFQRCPHGQVWRLFARVQSNGQPSARGEMTIQILGLNSPALLDRYRAHVTMLERDILLRQTLRRAGAL